MANSEKVIKYTIIPKNDNDDYDKNFKLSLKEFAKSLESKSLIAPLILYNSDLDVPMDMEEELEEYCIYTNQDNLIPIIKNHEKTDIFRCLVLHGFDISLDDIRDIYCPISRKNEADICINVIQESELAENLTFYLRNDLDQSSDEEWEEDKKQIEEDMVEYINEYLTYEDLSEEEMMKLLPYLLSGDMDEFDNKMADIRKEKAKENNKEELKNKDESNNKIIHIPFPEENMQINEQLEEEPDKTITCSYECDGLIALSKIEDDFYVIEDDDYEMALNLDQMLFLIESFNRIKDKPIK